jgi:hypothetical protein
VCSNCSGQYEDPEVTQDPEDESLAAAEYAEGKREVEQAISTSGFGRNFLTERRRKS